MAATRSAWASSRTRAITSWPCSCSSVSMCDPMKPVEPVSVTFIIRHPPVLIDRAARGELGARKPCQRPCGAAPVGFPDTVPIRDLPTAPVTGWRPRTLPARSGWDPRIWLPRATPCSWSAGRTRCLPLRAHTSAQHDAPSNLHPRDRPSMAPSAACRQPPVRKRPAEAGWLTCAELIEHMVGTGTALVTDGERPARATHAGNAEASGGRGRPGDRKLRRDAAVRLNFHEGQLARAALAEGGGGAVGGEHVGVAVTAKARVGRVRVVPGAGGKLGDPGPHRFVDSQPGQAGTPVVEDPYEVAVAQAAGCCVGRMQPHRFTPGDLERLAVRADVQLAVQPGPRLVGDQLQAEAPGGGRAEPFVRFAPDRVARAVWVTVAVDGFREDFDFPGRRGERVTFRVGAEISKRHLRFAGHRQFEAVACPELVKTRYCPSPLSQCAPPLVIQVAQPVHRGAALGEVLARAEPFR